MAFSSFAFAGKIAFPKSQDNLAYQENQTFPFSILDPCITDGNLQKPSRGFIVPLVPKAETRYR